MKKYKFFFTCIIVLFIVSCKPERFNGYKIGYDDLNKPCIAVDKADTIDIYNREGVYIRFHRIDGSVYETIRLRDVCIIGGIVLSTSADSVFLLVEQKPLRYIMDKYGLYYRYNRSDEKQKAFDEIHFRQYWIINQISNDVYGPLDTLSYLMKRKELGVTKSLKLEFEDKIYLPAQIDSAATSDKF